MLRLQAEPRLLATDEAVLPMLLGLRRCVILHPRPLLERCSPAELRMVLAHELGHLRRRDLGWSLLPAAAGILLFFHPLVWLAMREWQFWQEAACDELTLTAASATPADYGRLLLRITTGDASLVGSFAAAGMAGSYEILKRRLTSLERYAPRRPPNRWALAVLILALATLIPWRAVSASQVSFLDLWSAANDSLDGDMMSSIHAGNNLAALPRGEQVFAGCRFVVRDRFLQLAGRPIPERPARIGGIDVHRRFSTLAILQGTGWGSAAPEKAEHVPDGTLIGEYRVHYAGGGVESIPVVYGEDVRDWWMPADRSERPTGRGRLAWTGNNPAAERFGSAGARLYVTTWRNPHPDRLVTSLDLRSTVSPAAPFCIAITCGE